MVMSVHVYMRTSGDLSLFLELQQPMIDSFIAIKVCSSWKGSVTVGKSQWFYNRIMGNKSASFYTTIKYYALLCNVPLSLNVINLNLFQKKFRNRDG